MFLCDVCGTLDLEYSSTWAFITLLTQLFSITLQISIKCFTLSSTLPWHCQHSYVPISVLLHLHPCLYFFPSKLHSCAIAKTQKAHTWLFSLLCARFHFKQLYWEQGLLVKSKGLSGSSVLHSSISITVMPSAFFFFFGEGSMWKDMNFCILWDSTGYGEISLLPVTQICTGLPTWLLGTSILIF